MKTQQDSNVIKISALTNNPLLLKAFERWRGDNGPVNQLVGAARPDGSFDAVPGLEPFPYSNEVWAKNNLLTVRIGVALCRMSSDEMGPKIRGTSTGHLDALVDDLDRVTGHLRAIADITEAALHRVALVLAAAELEPA